MSIRFVIHKLFANFANRLAAKADNDFKSVARKVADKQSEKCAKLFELAKEQEKLEDGLLEANEKALAEEIAAIEMRYAAKAQAIYEITELAHERHVKAMDKYGEYSAAAGYHKA